MSRRHTSKYADVRMIPVSFLSGFLLFGILFALFTSSCSGRNQIGFESGERLFPADGKSTGRVLFRGLTDPNFIKIENESLLEILEKKQSVNSVEIYFRSTRKTGSVRFYTEQGEELTLEFRATSMNTDLDRDGFPDESELWEEEARNSFRRWFVRIAESQHLRASIRWNKNERDCSGLIRFAYREALKRHDREWREQAGFVVDGNVADSYPFYYPDVPTLGERIFRTGPKDFGTFAGARQLALFHTTRVSRNLEDGLPGDLVFFYNPTSPELPYHSMILVENRPGQSILLYHTGEGDTIKRVEAGYLKKSVSYRPHPSNPRFLGLFRFSILE